jgi:uncharacterized membrane protein
MQAFTTTIDIKAPPQRVWAVLSDIEGWPEWTPSVKSVERLDSGPLVVGTRARLRQPKLRPAIWQITKVERGSHFTWVTRSLGLRVTAHHVIEPLKKGSTSRVTLSVASRPPASSAAANRSRDWPTTRRYNRLLKQAAFRQA